MRRFPDKRTGSNIKYSMEDVTSATFSVFFTQSPSFLAYQTAMTETHGNSNAQTLFGMRSIPTDNHIRDLLDAVPPQQVFPMFERIFTTLHERGHLQVLQTFDGQISPWMAPSITNRTVSTASTVLSPNAATDKLSRWPKVF